MPTYLVYRNGEKPTRIELAEADAAARNRIAAETGVSYVLIEKKTTQHIEVEQVEGVEVIEKLKKRKKK